MTVLGNPSRVRRPAPHGLEHDTAPPAAGSSLPGGTAALPM